MAVGYWLTRLYCSPECRVATTSRVGSLSVEVEHVDDDTGGRPLGRVWLVKLRCGRHEVVVAADLGRPSADHLASQIAQLINQRRQVRGAAME